MPITSAPPPPRNTPNVSSAGASPTRRTPKVTQEREELVASLGMFAQMPLVMTKQLADAAAIGLHWPKIAHEVAVLAETQEPIANLIDPLIKVGPYAGLIAAVMPFAMQIAVNHGRLKPGSMGTVPAVSLEAQMETSMAQAELHALQVQQEAEEQAARVRAEIQQSRNALADAMRDHVHETADVVSAK